MTAWLAVALVGGGSYAFRLLPLVLADRWTPGPGAVRSLRHAGIAALSAIAASSLHSPSLTGSGRASLATAAALAAGAVAVWRRGSMAVVVAVGAAAHGAVLAGSALLA